MCRQKFKTSILRRFASQDDNTSLFVILSVSEESVFLLFKTAR